MHQIDYKLYIDALQWLASGMSHEEIISDFPQIKRKSDISLSFLRS